MTYTFDQLVNYIRGWFGSETDFQSLSVAEMSAALHNASVTIDSPDDGIEQQVKSAQLKCYRFNSDQVEFFSSDEEARNHSRQINSPTIEVLNIGAKEWTLMPN